MTEQKETRFLPVELTPEEKIELGNRIADLNINIEEMMEEKKALPKRIEGQQEVAASLSHKYKKGTDDRDVECYWVNDDPEPGMKSLYRTDTAELVISQPMDLLDGATDPQLNLVDQIDELQRAGATISLDEDAE